MTGGEILLLRHGETAENARGVYLGREDVPLSTGGRSALRSGRYPRAGLVLTSPLLRCRQTAELLYPGRDQIVIEALAERDFGLFSGFTHGEITARPGYGDWGMDEAHMEFPGGEPLDAFLARCGAAWEAVIAAAAPHNGDRCAVITHGGVIMGIMDGLFPGQGLYAWQRRNGCGYLLGERDGVETYQPWDGVDL